MFSVFFSRESHGFASVRGTVVLSRESRSCLSETKKNMFSVFFLPRESPFCFHDRHGCGFARGTGVPLSERENNYAPGSVFSSGFFCEKKVCQNLST